MKRSPLRKRAKVKTFRKLVIPRGYTSLRKQAWVLMSEYVRRRDKGVCFTCGVVKPWREMDAGHFHHNCLDFEEKNIHAQCTKCNRYLHGNLGVYATRLVKKYGDGILIQLEQAKYAERPLLYDDLPALIKSLVLKLDSLDKLSTP